MGRTDWARTGRRIKRLRLERGWTQRELGGRDLTAAAISQIETAKRRASADVLRYIAQKLGTTEEYLVHGRAPDLEARLRLETEQCRLACHQGKAREVLTRIDALVEEARRFDLTAEVASAIEVRGVALQKQGRYEEAVEEYDRAAELLASAPPERRVGAVTGRARCLYLMHDVRYALHVLESYLIELRRRPVADPSALAHVYTALIGPYFKSGLVEKARAAAEEAERLAARVSEPDVVGCTYINLAGVYLGDQLVDEAVRVLTKAEECFHQLEWTEEVATSHLAQALAFIEKEEWEDARVRLMHAVDALRRMPNSTMYAAVLNQLGKVERMTGDLDAAERRLSKALELVSEGNLNERGFAQRELGLCARDRGDLEDTRRWLLAAIDSYRLASNAQQLGVTYIELGDLERERGYEDASSRFYREGLEVTTAARAGA